MVIPFTARPTPKSCQAGGQLQKTKMGPIDAITKPMVGRGSYALEVMFKDYPGEIYAARKDSPMIIGIAEKCGFGRAGILKYTRSVYYIGNRELARLTPGKAVFYDLNGDEVEDSRSPSRRRPLKRAALSTL